MIVPRWNFGTWSAIVAMNGASVMFAPSCASAQPIVATSRLGARAMMRNATVMMTVPRTTQMRRRPHLLVVRSDTRPNTTFAIVANSAPTPPRIAAAPVAPFSGITPAATSDWILMPIPTMAGPNRAMKNTSCAMSSQTT